MDRIDPFLTSEFEAAAARPGPELESVRGGAVAAVLPMLLRVAHPRWLPRDVRDYKERFRTGNIIGCSGTATTVADLSRDSDVLSVEFSREGTAAHLQCAVSVPYVNGTRVHGPPIAEQGDRAVVAVIDQPVDVLHEAFRDPTDPKRTRIAFLWDQRDKKNARTPSGYDVGTEYTAADVDGWIAKPSTLPASLIANNQRFEHGTHVASIAAGQASSSGKFAGGMAPRAQIIYVIPRMQVDPGDPDSLGYSQSHIAALLYIKDKVRGRRDPVTGNVIDHGMGLPVVVNLSAGMNAGAHDGTSALEAGFDSACEGGRLPGYVIVKSAGNEREWNGHTRQQISKNAGGTIEWLSKLPGSAGPRPADRIELWFKACDRYEFVLVDPNGESTSVLNSGNPNGGGTFLTGNRYDMSFVRHHPDNGDSRVTIVIRSDPYAPITDGTWTLKVTSREVKSAGYIHAWIERDNFREIEFTHPKPKDEMTLSIPATAMSVIAVGSVDGGSTPNVSRFSSFGPTRDGREKPDVSAPGENIRAARYGSVHDVVSLQGTSMAAPHVAGAVALLLSRRQKQCDADPNKNNPAKALKQYDAAQVRAAVRQAARDYRGTWNEGTGDGVLDAEALVETFS